MDVKSKFSISVSRFTLKESDDKVTSKLQSAPFGRQ